MDPVSKDGEKRGPDGKWLPGHTPPRSPGRRPLPAWFRARGESALRMLAAIATGEAMDDDSDAARLAAVEADPKLRAQCASEMADRIYGRPRQAPEMETPLPEGEVTPEQTIARLEQVLGALALQGDARAALALLAALDPARYGREAGGATSDAEAVDTVDFAPRVIGG